MYVCLTGVHIAENPAEQWLHGGGDTIKRKRGSWTSLRTPGVSGQGRRPGRRSILPASTDLCSSSSGLERWPDP